MVKNGIPELTLDQVEDLLRRAEETAREYVLSQVPATRIADLEVVVDVEGIKPLIVNVDVEIVLSPLMKDFNVEKLTKEATKRAFICIEENLGELECKSKK